MLKNQLIFALRSLIKRKFYTSINLVGFSLAISLSLLAFLYVRDEHSYNRIHKNSQSIFGLGGISIMSDDYVLDHNLFDLSNNTSIRTNDRHSIPFMELVKESIPEISQSVRLHHNRKALLLNDERHRESVLYTDPEFLSMFSFEMLFGDPLTALDEQRSVVLQESMAIKLFGRKDVVGEVVSFGDEKTEEYVVTGVIHVPSNSSIRPNMLMRFEQSDFYKNHGSNWMYWSGQLYVSLEDPANAEAVADKVRSLYTNRFPEIISAQRESLKLSEENPVQLFRLVSLGDMYFHPVFGDSNPLYSYIVAVIALLIMIIACVNYFSLSVSLCNARMKEASIHKVVGASRAQLTRLFQLESLVLGAVSLLLGYTLFQTLLPSFNDLTGKNLELGMAENLLVISFGLVFGLLVLFLGGIYPALVLSRVRPSNGLRGSTYKANPRLIQGMVLFQFILCIGFISVGITMNRQFQFINERNLGFDTEQVVYTTIWGKALQLKQQLANEPSIQNTVAVSSIFDSGRSTGERVVDGETHRITFAFVGYDFFETFGVDFIDGRVFDRNLNAEQEEQKLIINRTYHELMLRDSVNGYDDNVIGVIEDFHFESLMTQIEPMAFMLKTDGRYLSTLYAKLAPNSTEEGILAIKEAVRELDPYRQVEVRFLDEYIASHYDDYKKWSRLVNSATLVAIIIACIGLFGLSSLGFTNRTKEIGIRKVLGASFWSICVLLNRKTVVIVLIALMISIPVAYQVASGWLSSFVYRIPLNGSIFLTAGVSALVIALLTVSFHVGKANRVNPANMLRDE